MGSGSNGNRGKWCIGRVRDQGNQGGERGGILQQTEANGDQGKGEQSRKRPYREDKHDLGQ